MSKNRKRILRVSWDDANGGDEGWRSITKRHLKHVHRPCRNSSVGFCLREDKRGITLALSYDRREKTYGGYVFIPTCMIVKVTEL